MNRRAFWTTSLTMLAFGGCPAPPVDNSGVPLRFNESRAAALPVPAVPARYQHAALTPTATGFAGVHAPSITALPDGELLVAYYGYSGPEEFDGAAIFTLRRAPDGAWSEAQLHIDRAETDGNPTLYSEGDRVWLFQAITPARWSLSRIEFQISADRGRSWSAPRRITGPLGANVRHPPVRVADGGLLLPAYDDLVQRSLFFWSVDGETWRLRSALATDPPHENLQPSVAVLADGRLVGTLRNRGAGWLWVAASEDSGRSWSEPRDAGLPNPNAPAPLLRLASGNLLLVLNDSPTARRPISAMLSADEGVSWSAPRVLVDDEAALAYPAVAQSSDGGLHIVYSHDRRYIGYIETNEAFILGYP